VKERAGQYVQLSFSDTGRGIKREHLPRVFEPFFTTKDDGTVRGSGLGLASVYGIIKQHNGFIWVYSEEGEGTTFRIYLPAVDTVPGQTPDQNAEGAEATRPRAILVVEDEPQVLDITTRMLEQGGFETLTASSPDQALELAESTPNRIGLLLTDVILPSMDGRRLYESLKERIPELKVVFMSGYTKEVITNKGLLGDSAILLEKPFTSSELLGAIKKAMGKRGERKGDGK